MSMLDHQKVKEHSLAKPAETIQEAKPSPRPRSASIHLLADMTTLAWNLMIPIVGGVLLGHYLDNRLGEGAGWTLTLLVLGVIVALSNLYNLYVEHGHRQLDQDQKPQEGRARDA